ncbi:MAG: hypothetical protein GXY14_03910 [Spirochaetes bacterium]|nr:hypothetical protein [Spirochaetota bacterium]
MNFIRALILFLSFNMLVSCGPSVYHNIRITPALGSGIWQEGREVSQKTVNRVKVTVAFEKIDETEMVYDVTITNRGKTNILFDPAKVFCDFYFTLPEADTGTQTAGDALVTGKPDAVINAADPEQIIKAYETLKANEESSYESDQTANDVGCCIGTAGSLAADSDEERREYEEMQEDAERDSKRRESLHMERMQKMNEQTAYYEKEALRKTTVLPGQTVRGKVHIPVSLKAKLIVLNIPLNDLKFDFIYGQVIEKPVQKQNTGIE